MKAPRISNICRENTDGTRAFGARVTTHLQFGVGLAVRQSATGVLCALFLCATFVLAEGQSTVASVTVCADMLTVKLSNTTISSAQIVPASDGLPEYCSVVGVIKPAVNFEVRLPANWNGKMYFRGNGGFGGHIVFNTSLGLSRGYATVGTDLGHQSPDISDGSWALNNRAGEIDFGYRAVHVSTVVGKAIIRRYYGSSPSHSYFEGCSNGGRLGVQEAERYPQDFDGIIAGAPDIDFTGLMINFNWDMQALHSTNRHSDITPDKLPLIGAAVLAACDAIDGLVDGLIDDPRKCEFNPETLLCKGEDAPNCLTRRQVDALQKIYAGPHTGGGKQIYPGFARGGETPDASFNGFDVWLLSTSDFPSAGFFFQNQFFRYLAFKDDDPTYYWGKFDFDTDPQRTEFMGRLLNATDRSLASFDQAGGKLLIYQGWSDFAMTPFRTIEFYKTIQQDLGSERTDNFARLFMAPGMFHCFGGPGPDTFDYLTALERWVEKGSAPKSMVARHFDETGRVDRIRPLCAFPQVARYKGTGSIDRASSFRCVQPTSD